jgi:transcriptional regulator with XRE-family HTH domain
MTGPSIKAHLLGCALQQLRIKAGKTQREVAAHLECSSGKVTHIEQARYIIKKTDLESLLKFYGAEDQYELLESYRQDANKPGWWDTFHIPNWFEEYVGLEADANEILVFELELIPGLLQTEEYAVLTCFEETDAKKISKTVELRMKRQEKLKDENKTLKAIISESSIKRLMKTKVAEKQLIKILDKSKLPNIKVSILPFNAGLHKSMSGSFAVLKFPEETIRSMVYLGQLLEGHITDTPKIMSYFAETHQALYNQSLSDEESRAFLAQQISTVRGEHSGVV